MVESRRSSHQPPFGDKPLARSAGLAEFVVCGLAAGGGAGATKGNAECGAGAPAGQEPIRICKTDTSNSGFCKRLRAIDLNEGHCVPADLDARHEALGQEQDARSHRRRRRLAGQAGAMLWNNSIQEEPKMPRQILVMLALASAIAIAPASATTLSGTVTYADQTIGSTFPEMSYGQAGAIATGSNQWTYGTVDSVSGTYEIPGLTEGQWFVRVIFGTEDFGTRVQPEGGEVTGFDYIDIETDPESELDLGALYAYRITQPFAGVWPGTIASCPYGPALLAEFTFAWAPVPLAVRYDVWVDRWSCDGRLESILTETNGTSIQILQGTVAGEEYVVFEVIGYSAGGHEITVPPYLDYENGRSNGAYVHQGEAGRSANPSTSVFVSQVARLPGVPPSFWTSDVVLTNTGSSPVVATLTFTPRDANGLTNYLTETVTIPTGSCRVLSDVVGSVFGTTGAGSLEVSPHTLLVTSRISTPGSEGGTYGQGFPAGEVGYAASQTGPITKLGAGGLARGAFRSNLVLTEVWGENANVLVTVLDRDGVVLGTRAIGLQPFGTTQLNDVVGQVGGPATLEEGQVTVEVTSGSGRVISALSLVDAVSQDPTTLELEPR